MNSDTSKVLVVILIIFLLTTVINIAYHSFAKQYRTETAIEYSTSNKATFNGVYIRDEQVLTFDGGGVISYVVPDGGKLSKNSVVAYIYSTEQDIEIKQDISKLQSELDVLVKIQNPGTTEVAQPSNLSSLIEELYLNIVYNKELGNMAKVQSDKSELLVLLSTMQIVTDPESSFQGRIDDLNAQITELEKQLSNPISTIWVDKPAYFISYVDGYEGILSTSNMYDLTVEDINDVNDEVDDLDTTNVVGKLIDDYRWYMVGVIDNSKGTFSVGNTVTLKLESSAITTTGKITQIKDTDNPNESIVYVVCNQLTEGLVQHRVETVEMSVENYEGIRVPKEALRFMEVTETDEDGTEMVVDYEGVYVKVGEKYQFKKIEVIYRGDDYVISEALADDDYLSLYDDIILESVG